jgi:hypothetical protein
MPKKAYKISFLMLLVLLTSALFCSVAKALPQSNGLTLLEWYYPSEVYVGQLFSVGINIYNNDSIGHNYTVIWLVAGYDFYSHGNIGAHEKLNVTEVLTLNDRGSYLILIELLQDGNHVIYDYKTISVVEAKFTFTYYTSKYPLYVGETFDVNITISNAGNGEAFDASFHVKALREKGLAPLNISTYLQLNNVSSGEIRTIKLAFNSSKQGIYMLSTLVDYYDLRNVHHAETFNIPIEISSRTVLDDLETTQDTNQHLQAELQQLRRDILYITVIFSVLIVCVGVVNYALMRRSFERRKVQQPALKKKQS